MSLFTRPSEWRLPSVKRSEVDLRIVPLGFLSLITMGTVLLVLPWAHRSGHSLGFIDAFFVATSATCVTGLSPVDISATFNLFGQIVLLALIQLGGLGIFTGTILLALLGNGRLSVPDEQAIQGTVGKLRQARPLDVFIYSCVLVFLFELAGTVIFFLFSTELTPSQSVWQNLWESLFHSVSSFCNAGISIYPEGMARWKNNPAVLFLVMLLVICGGIGLMTFINLRYYYFWRKDRRRRGYLTLQTRLVLLTTGVLLVAGTILTLSFEQDNTLRGVKGWDNLWYSLFHSTMTRTAGFNVVDISGMKAPTLLGTLLLMFIGGSPGSMAGGIKTVTFIILILTAWNALRRREEIQIFGRQIPRKVVGTAIMITLLAFAFVIVGVGLLMISENNHSSLLTPQHWLGLVFEAISAFGTVGLSTGATPLLTTAGKYIIIALMFVGRVGPLVLSVYLTRPANLHHVRFPKEELSLG